MSKIVNVSPSLRGHYERMSECVRHYFKDLHNPYEVTASEDYVDNGRILKKSVRKTVDPTKLNSGVLVSDLYLENIISVGAIDSLHECKLSLGTLPGADNVDAQIGAIDAVASADVNVEPQNNQGE